MMEVGFALAFIIMLGIWELLKLVWLFILWVTSPIRDDLALRRMAEEELRKEQRLVEMHREAVQQIDDVVADYLDRNEQALAQSDDDPGRRQSDPSSKARSMHTVEPERVKHEPQPVVRDAPKGTHLWFSNSTTGRITLRAGKRQNGAGMQL